MSEAADEVEAEAGAEAGVETGAGPALVFARLAVEQRIVGLLALLGLAYLAWFTAWLALALEPEDLAALASRPTPLILVAAASLVAASVDVALRLPTLRWPRRDGDPGPGSLPLAIAGAPSLLVWPLLLTRDRRARAAACSPDPRVDPSSSMLATPGLGKDAVEGAFVQLLATPRISATSFGLWTAGATLVLAALVGRASGVAPATLALMTLLSLATLSPLVSLATTRIRAMLVPEYLAAPRPDPLALPVQHSVALRLGGPAGLALLGAVIVPALVGALWTQRVARDEARATAARAATSLLSIAESTDGEHGGHGEHSLEVTLAQHPHHGLITPEQSFGDAPASLRERVAVHGGPLDGPVDSDGDGRIDRWLASSADASLVAVAPLPPRPPTSISTWLAIIVLGVGMGLATLTLLLRDVERDVRRASRQVATVAEGEIPKPMAVETFATAELRGLVAAVDRLVGRISDANVHKYVLIERGHEADRLKSQFLANMSHDLRSPLNSVIGFSELLTTGIEGELQPAQLEMVELIHATGKALLQQIDDILDTAKIEAGRMELVREPMPPATLISRAIEKARVRLPAAIDFDTSFAPGLPPAFADPYRSTQALENVLLFAAEGLEQGRVEIACEAPRDPSGTREVVIRIVSPRALVSLSVLEQARRGFFRLPGHSGLGLGLPIATSILELQGGELLIEDGSSRNLGGRAAMAFELRLPALTPRRSPVLRRG